MTKETWTMKERLFRNQVRPSTWWIRKPSDSDVDNEMHVHMFCSALFPALRRVMLTCGSFLFFSASVEVHYVHLNLRPRRKKTQFKVS